MRVTRRKHEKSLKEYPGWALEVMIGLYGEQQIRDAVAAERGTATPTPSAQVADLDAVGSMFDRLRRRH